MGQPNECNCQCGFEAAKKYTCYNGFCVEDDLGEYNEPTCGGNCPIPTQYACVSGYCIPTAGGAYNNPTCNGNCPVMPTKRYSCLSSVCTQVKGGSYYDPTCSGNCAPRSINYGCVSSSCVKQIGGPYKNDPFCAGNCNPVIDFRYDCNVNGLCVQTINGRYINDPTCGGNCEPSGILYKCQDGQCVQAGDGTFLNDPTCNGTCAPSSGNYLLVNCQDENESIVATAPSGAYKPPFNGVWKIDNECWRMVGEIECPCSPPPIILPDTQTAGCDSCNNGVCCFEVWPCSWTLAGDSSLPDFGFSCNINTGKCEPSEGGTYGPLCNGECDTFYYKICVSGLNPTACSSYAGKVIKINPCDDPLVGGDFGPPCSPAPGWMAGAYPCQCCFLVINPIPEDPEATHHNFVNVYNNCCECNPCSETKNCNPGETFQNVNCQPCDCVCLDPPCGGEPPTTGACCYADCDAISCTEDVTEEECAGYYGGNGTFIPGGTCSACEPEGCNPSTGECCGGYECDGFGNCVPVAVGMSLAECQSMCYAPE